MLHALGTTKLLHLQKLLGEAEAMCVLPRFVLVGKLLDAVSRPTLEVKKCEEKQCNPSPACDQVSGEGLAQQSTPWNILESLSIPPTTNFWACGSMASGQESQQFTPCAWWPWYAVFVSMSVPKR